MDQVLSRHKWQPQCSLFWSRSARFIRGCCNTQLTQPAFTGGQMHKVHTSWRRARAPGRRPHSTRKPLGSALSLRVLRLRSSCHKQLISMSNLPGDELRLHMHDGEVRHEEACCPQQRRCVLRNS